MLKFSQRYQSAQGRLNIEYRSRRLYTIRMAEKRTVSEAFDRAAREVEAEVKRAIDYIEANIVPKARRDGEKVLRSLSEELKRWADRLHDEEQNQ
jgi:hypothetical protein